jgi:SagB-type dehydrogenase family enzyme
MPKYVIKAKKLQDIFKKRKSIRSFKRFLEVKELAVWLSHAYFQYQNEKNDKYENVNSSRSIASGGALYPIELYFINLNVQNLARGVYLYDDKNLNLQKIQGADISPEALDRAFYFNLRKDWQVKDISGILVFVHVAHRISFKYGSRGLRLAMFDVGALCQNLYLLAGQMENLACCANAGYLDDELNDLLGLVAGQEESLLTLIVGGM